MAGPDPLHCPDTEELKRFMRGELSRPEVLPVVRHLLTGCPECVMVTRRFWNLGDEAPCVPEETLAGKSADDRTEPAHREEGLL